LTDPAAANPDLHVLEQLLAVFRRRWKSILLFIVLGIVLGFLYAESQPPQYAPSATILVRSGFAADPMRQGIETTTPEEEGQFLSQLEYVRSASVAAAVADKLDLAHDAEFNKAELSGYKRLVSLFERVAHVKTGLVKQPEQAAPNRDRLIARLQANVRVRRAGRTYVAAISYTHPDPVVAQKVAQAFAEVFRDTLAKASDAGNARVRAAVEAELAKATPETRPALQQKYQEMIVSRALPGVDVVVISDAAKPGTPVAPRKPLLIAIGAILGAALGCLLAGWREMHDRGFRDGDLLAQRLRARFLGYVPRMSVDRKPGALNGTAMTLPAGARLAVTDPYSRFSEAVRAAAVAAMASRKEDEGRVVAIASTLVGEGKTVLAANLASQLGNQGRSVLLIDGDFRHPEISNWFAPGAEFGSVDVLLQNKPLTEAGLYDSRNNVTLLPAALNGRGVEPTDLLGGEPMRKFIAEQRSQQHVIIIDLPSLTTAADAQAVAPLVDAFILVAEWGTPSTGLVENVLASAPDVAAKIAGVVVTKTDLARLPLYVTSASRGAYRKRVG
jgi:Mrp family chromosome partitioning ATPase